MWLAIGINWDIADEANAAAHAIVQEDAETFSSVASERGRWSHNAIVDMPDAHPLLDLW